ncbi:leucine carboxyl methyltransferase [Verticillium dahliae]|nr:leucine carboxyl methyltransferase [Verticillium dahliae]
MSHDTIPNLLSLRGPRSASGRGRTTAPPGFPSRATNDQAIQGTDDDAAASRLSAVSLGYLQDSFAQYFVQTQASLAPRRLPIINRGTYTRTCALNQLVDSFLAEDDRSFPNQSKERQIISLGAGTDTRIFRIFGGRACHNLTYHELDFPVTVTKKSRLVSAIPHMRRVLGEQVPQPDGSWSCRPPSGGEYYCHGIDLRELPQGGNSQLKGLKNNVPTLLISECCLCYLEASAAESTVQWFAKQIENLALVVYEPIRPHDPFGKMMVSNLAARRIRMPTLESYPLPADQEARLRTAGFKHASAQTIEYIWENWVSPQERERVNGLEGLDEVEEWQLLADHYVVAWAWRGEGFGGWQGACNNDESR